MLMKALVKLLEVINFKLKILHPCHIGLKQLKYSKHQSSKRRVLLDYFNI